MCPACALRAQCCAHSQPTSGSRTIATPQAHLAADERFMQVCIARILPHSWAVHQRLPRQVAAPKGACTEALVLWDVEGKGEEDVVQTSSAAQRCALGISRPGAGGLEKIHSMSPRLPALLHRQVTYCCTAAVPQTGTAAPPPAAPRCRRRPPAAAAAAGLPPPLHQAAPAMQAIPHCTLSSNASQCASIHPLPCPHIARPVRSTPSIALPPTHPPFFPAACGKPPQAASLRSGTLQGAAQEARTLAVEGRIEAGGSECHAGHAVLVS